MKHEHGRHSLLVNEVHWKAARRARERLLAIGLGLVALMGTGLFAAVDQLFLQDAFVETTCAPSDEGGGTSPVLTPVAKFGEPVAPEHGLNSDMPDGPGVERSRPPLRSVALEENSGSQDEPRATGSVRRATSLTRVDHVAAGPIIRGDTVTASPIGTAECLPPALRDVLAEFSARFGAVTVVASHQVTTVNHRSGSFREGLHHACKAVDFRPDRNRIREIKAYLRSRHEIGGVESYRDGVVHIDFAAGLERRLQTPPVRSPVLYDMGNAVQRATTSVAHAGSQRAEYRR